MKILFFDLETSGLSVRQHEIIQIAIAAVVDWEIVMKWEAKVDFDMKIADYKALEMNSFCQEVWEKEAREPKEVIREVRDIMRDFSDISHISERSGKEWFCSRMAGHNVAKFDMPFIERWFKKYDIFRPCEFTPLDTLQLAIWKAYQTNNFPENYKLKTLCEFHGVDLENAHDALGDVVATVKLAQKLIKE